MQNKTSSTIVPPGFNGEQSFLYKFPNLAYAPYRRARDQWIASQEVPDALEILDVGCSIGEALQPWTDSNHIVGIDRNAGVLEIARRNGYAETIVGDFNTHNFADRQFDAIAAFGIVGANSSPSIDLNLFRSLLRPSGTLYFIVALHGGLRKVSWTLFRLFSERKALVKIPTFNSLPELLRTSGFQMESLSTSRIYLGANVTDSASYFQRATAIYAFVRARVDKH